MRELLKFRKNLMQLYHNSFIKFSSSEAKSRPDYDFDYICNKSNIEEIAENISLRKGIGDINKVNDLYSQYKAAQKINDITSLSSLEKLLQEEARKIPNKTHPSVKNYGMEPKVVKLLNEEPNIPKAHEFADLTRKLNIMRTDQLGTTAGHRSYYFMGELAELEEALIKYSIKNLLNKGFKLVSVPDILPRHIIESCGMTVTGDRCQIYSLDSSHHGPELCLSGTAEMSLAGLLMNSQHKEKDLPLKLAAVSRCYRAETSSVVEQKGIYRVHQFTKVEMFGVTTPQHSEQILEEFRSLEEESFSNLGLHMRVLDMPPHELGAPAYRKYDIEAWMPGRKMFGEISSCSNCTDYQSRRLNIRYSPSDGSSDLHVHTLNGTACAIPRMLIAILETHQQDNGKISVPKPLQKYMSNKEFIVKKKSVPELKLIKTKI